MARNLMFIDKSAIQIIFLEKIKELFKMIILVICFSLFLNFNVCSAKTKEKETDIFLKWQKAMKLRQSYKYSPVSFDPFRSIIVQLKSLPVPQNITIFLKNYDLSDLKLVGIIDTGDQKIAVIEDPSGKGFFLKIGDYIGSQAGKIIRITKCAVYISQKFIDQQGNIIESPKPYIMKLSSEDGRCLE
ncbi:pilus assembly protein PilP [Thermodesulfatator indicus]